MNSFYLKELLEIKNGRDHQHLSDGNIPIYGSGGLMRLGNQFIYDQESILLPRKGTLSNIQFVNKPFWTVDTLYYTIVNKEKANAYFLYHYLKRLDLSNLNSGTGVPSMTFGAYYDVKLEIPDLQIQNKIASVLYAVDDKIELNTKINTELEQLAKTLYDYWFVQFDFPDANGKPYKSSGGEMVYNNVLKREIPKGWEVINLFKTSNVQYGFPFSTDFFNKNNIGVPIIRIRDILNNSISNYSNQENIDDKYIIKKGDILVGMDGNFHINYWSKDNCYLNQRVVMIKETSLPSIYTRYQIEPYIQLREKSVSRTTVGHLSDKDLKALNIIIPCEKILNIIKPLFNTYLQKIVSSKQQNQELAQLRDWLLPMLMNGQIKIKNI
jgi:type I restriction enzyme S subunit